MLFPNSWSFLVKIEKIIPRRITRIADNSIIFVHPRIGIPTFSKNEMKLNHHSKSCYSISPTVLLLYRDQKAVDTEE